ncbi:MAG TPA: hypothetical protein QGF05_02755 [Dehalococcoidia bacterium]|nr:hypothetical protein [Dehalococcoidia bacterium]
MLTIVTALPWEADRFTQRLRGRRHTALGDGWAIWGTHGCVDVRVVVSGPGLARVRAARSAIESLDPAPTGILATGAAVGLTDDLRPGHVVIASALLATSITSDGSSKNLGARLKPDDALTTFVKTAAASAGLRSHEGTNISVDRELLTPAEKRREHQRSAAIVGQMEDYAWAETAGGLGVPFASGRVILDHVTTSIPAAVMEWDWQGPRAAEVARSIARRPWLPPSLARLGWQRIRARRSIDRLLESVVQLGTPAPGEPAP